MNHQKILRNSIIILFLNKTLSSELGELHSDPNIPVRAFMVKSPQDYKWSSYHSNVRGTYDPIVFEHPSYNGLAKFRKARQEAYRDLFLEHLEESLLLNIRNCAQTGTPLGNNKFKEQIEAKLKIKVGYNTRGRPKKFK